MFSMSAHPSASSAAAARGRPGPRDLLRLVRPGQWAKSLLVVPLVLVQPAAWAAPHPGALVAAVALFVLASAVVYIGNDLADAELDRRHPVKRARPVASGRVPVSTALALGGLLSATTVALALSTVPTLLAPVGGYVGLNAVYSRWLKHVALLDVFVVAAGFALRVLAGELALGVRPSGWLLLGVFLLCLLPVIGKRRRELDLPAPLRRPVLGGYTAAFLDHMLVLAAGLAVVAFVLYAVDGWGSAADLVLAVGLPPALFGLFRYVHLVLVCGGGADPTRSLLRDRALLVSGALCLCALTGAGLLVPTR